MNRILVGFAVIVCSLMGIGVQSLAAQARLGYINSQVILAEAPGTQDAQSQFESAMGTFRQELDTLESELTTLQDNYQRQQATLTAAQRQAQEQEIQQRFMAYQQRRQELEQTAQQRQAELVQPIMDRISEVIEEIRAEGNYSMIFDAAAGGLITADPALDLTEQVLERLGA